MISRRGFFGALAGAAAALVVPKKSYFFGMGMPRPAQRAWKWSYSRILFIGKVVNTVNPVLAMGQHPIELPKGPCRCGMGAHHEHHTSADFAAAMDIELTEMKFDYEREVDRWFRSQGLIPTRQVTVEDLLRESFPPHVIADAFNGRL